MTDGLAVRADRRALIAPPIRKGTDVLTAIAVAHARWIDADFAGLDPAGLERLDALAAIVRGGSDAR